MINLNVRHKSPRSLICNEGYEVGFTRHDRPYFNARPIDPSAFDPAIQTLDPTNEFDWTSRGALLAVTPLVRTDIPLLLADNYRNLLIIQNNSQGSTANGDVMPVLSVSLDGPVGAVSNLPGGPINPYVINLAPGVGLVLDTRIVTNALYVRWGIATNSSLGTFFQGATVLYGRTLNSPPPSRL